MIFKKVLIILKPRSPRFDCGWSFAAPGQNSAKLEPRHGATTFQHPILISSTRPNVMFQRRLLRKPQFSFLFQSFSRRHVSDDATRTRLDKVIQRMPRVMQKYTNRLRNAPVSHAVSFLILHEITAIAPVVGLSYYFHVTNWLPVVRLTLLHSELLLTASTCRNGQREATSLRTSRDTIDISERRAGLAFQKRRMTNSAARWLMRSLGL